MAITGRKPKPESERRNRVRPVHDWLEVECVPFVGARKLPHRRPTGLPWPKETKRWWQAVSTMPHCVIWQESDWRFALDTAIVAAAFHDGDLQRAKELRDREKVMGTTADARRDLRIRYIDPIAPEERQGVTAIDTYRRRLE